jgi:hypothetical protein
LGLVAVRHALLLRPLILLLVIILALVLALIPLSVRR